MNAAGRTAFESWAIVELFGHTRMAGLVTEATIGGQAFVRVDVPQTAAGEPYTQYLGPGSIYRLTPTTEEMAVAVAGISRPKPVQAWELQRRPELPPCANQPETPISDDALEELPY